MSSHSRRNDRKRLKIPDRFKLYLCSSHSMSKNSSSSSAESSSRSSNAAFTALSEACQITTFSSQTCLCTRCGAEDVLRRGTAFPCIPALPRHRRRQYLRHCECCRIVFEALCCKIRLRWHLEVPKLWLIFQPFYISLDCLPCFQMFLYETLCPVAFT